MNETLKTIILLIFLAICILLWIGIIIYWIHFSKKVMKVYDVTNINFLKRKDK